MNKETNEFSKMSAVELNEQLIKVFDLLPQRSQPESRYLVDYINQLAIQTLHRGKTELITVLDKKLKEILQHSYLTPATRNIVRRNYNHMFALGVDKANLEENVLFKLLEIKSPTGGIFNSEEAIEINRNIIKDSQTNGISMQFAFPDTKVRDDLLVSAKHEFVEKWGNEP